MNKKFIYKEYIQTLKDWVSKGTKPFKFREKENGIRLMIIVSGSGGKRLIKEARKSKECNYKVLSFIDINNNLGRYLGGIKVSKNRKEIVQLSEKYKIDEIFIETSELDSKRKKELLNLCMKTSCRVKLIQCGYKVSDKKNLLKDLRDVTIDDLIEKEAIRVDIEGIRGSINNKRIMIAGGGGAVGSELCRLLIRFNPKQILILDKCESSAYNIFQELKRKGTKVEVNVILASINNKDRMNYILNKFRPEIIFHTAFYKYVPMMEENIGEIVENNIFGTLNLAELSEKYGTEKFIMISSDRTINPTNVIDLTDKTAEMIVQAMDHNSRTKFAAVRFEEILGSKKDSIELLIKEIKDGENLTVSPKDISGSFINISEVTKLILQASVFVKGGEVFTLSTQSSEDIYSLIWMVFKLSKAKVNSTIIKDFPELFPGERSIEEPPSSDEVALFVRSLRKTAHKQIFLDKPSFFVFQLLKKKLDELRGILDKENKEDNGEKMIRKLEESVPYFKASKEDNHVKAAEG